MARRKAPDPKTAALRKHYCLYKTPEKVRDKLFRTNEFFDRRDLVQVRYEMLRRVRVEGQPVTEVAEAFGVSRPTFYQTAAAFEQSGLAGLLPRRLGPKRAHKLDDKVVDFLRERLEEDSSLRGADLVRLVQERFGRSVHARSISRALVRQEKKRR
jgi:transposase